MHAFVCINEKQKQQKMRFFFITLQSYIHMIQWMFISFFPFLFLFISVVYIMHVIGRNSIIFFFSYFFQFQSEKGIKETENIFLWIQKIKLDVSRFLAHVRSHSLKENNKRKKKGREKNVPIFLFSFAFRRYSMRCHQLQPNLFGFLSCITWTCWRCAGNVVFYFYQKIDF